MDKRQFLEYCLHTYGTSPDYPFDEDFETAVLRHSDNRKWYAIVMRVSRRKFGFDSDEVINVVNLKLPTEMFGSFNAADGVYPACRWHRSLTSTPVGGKLQLLLLWWISSQIRNLCTSGAQVENGTPMGYKSFVSTGDK